ncbi:MAG TPA: rhomboid family intramembrane serine protease [Candidatus Acidoferrum sp.]|nr:rhomboid family intramembrane serine protease [Candidatus Acidoferrum sp.]
MPLSPRLRWKIDQFKRKMSVAFGGAEKENGRPKLCPACGTLVGASATRCHMCGASLRFSLAAASRSLSKVLPETSPATYAILTFSCVMYAISLLWTVHISGFQMPQGGGFSALFSFGGINGEVLERLGASLPLVGFFGGRGDLTQPWRFVTAVFLHGGLLHIGFNMWVLMDVGPMVEELYGSGRFLFIYVATGIFGYFVSSFFGHMSIGGSGALLGIIGVMLALTMGHKTGSMRVLRGQIIWWLVYIAIFGLFFQGIDNYAHAGGFVAGFVLGKIMADRTPSSAEERKRAYFLGWASALLVLASFAMVILNLYRPFML